MSRCFVYALPIVLVVLAPAVSRAQSPACPDGWFCEPNAAPVPSAPGQPPAPSQPPPPAPSQPVAPAQPPASAQPAPVQPAPAQPAPVPPPPAAAPRPAVAPGYPPPGYPPPGYPPPGYPPPGYYPPGYPPPVYSAPVYPAPVYPAPVYPAPVYPAPVYPVPPPPPGGQQLSPEGSSDLPPPPPKRPHRRGFREWGFNLHLEGLALARQSDHVSKSMLGGLGFGFRYRPLPALAFETGLDFLSGNDKEGYTRNEIALTLNALVYFNPRDVAQVYVLGGARVTGANVAIVPRSGEPISDRREEHYEYFGGHLGLGLEVRVSQRVAIAGDLVGFVRNRTDDLKDQTLELIDRNTQRSNDTSRGGLLRGGVTFYW